MREYCRLSQAGQEARVHIDHVVPVTAGGPTTFAHLALTCVSCSLRKGARRSAIDPQTGVDVPLFGPRDQNWDDHFRRDGASVLAITPTGHATVAMNRSLNLAIRREEAARGRHPP